MGINDFILKQAERRFNSTEGPRQNRSFDITFDSLVIRSRPCHVMILVKLGYFNLTHHFFHWAFGNDVSSRKASLQHFACSHTCGDGVVLRQSHLWFIHFTGETLPWPRVPILAIYHNLRVKCRFSRLFYFSNFDVTFSIVLAGAILIFRVENGSARCYNVRLQQNGIIWWSNTLRLNLRIEWTATLLDFNLTSCHMWR